MCVLCARTLTVCLSSLWLAGVWRRREEEARVTAMEQKEETEAGLGKVIYQGSESERTNDKQQASLLFIGVTLL